MELLIRVAIVGLAAWRAAALLSYEDGPFRVFARLRAAIAVPDGLDGALRLDSPVDRLRHEIELAISCVWCVGVYTAGAGWLLWELSPTAVGAGAAAAVVVMVERWCRG